MTWKFLNISGRKKNLKFQNLCVRTLAMPFQSRNGKCHYFRESWKLWKKWRESKKWRTDFGIWLRLKFILLKMWLFIRVALKLTVTDLMDFSSTSTLPEVEQAFRREKSTFRESIFCPFLKTWYELVPTSNRDD